MIAVLLAASGDRDLVRLVIVFLVALLLAGIAGYAATYFGAPQPLVLLIALIVFLLVFFGAGNF